MTSRLGTGKSITFFYSVRATSAGISMSYQSGLKPNSSTYNFVEVSGHNLGSFCVDFLNHGKGYLSDFPPVPFTGYSN